MGTRVPETDQVVDLLRSIPTTAKVYASMQQSWKYVYVTRFQMKMAKNIWAVWSRLARLADTASKIRTRLGETEVKRMKKDELVVDWSYIKMDMSWCSDYPLEQIKL